MLLARLRVRGKLAVLIATPLVLVMVLAAVVAVGRFDRARSATNTANTVEVASRIGGIVADLQQERLFSVGYLLGVAKASDVALASAKVGDDIVDVEGDLAGNISDRTLLELSAVSKLDDVRAQVAGNRVAADVVIDRFSATITGILDSLRLASGVDASTAAGREVIALDALLRIDELNNRSAAQLVVAAGTKSTQATVAYAGSRAAVDGILSQFTNYATSEQIALYGLVGKAFNDRIGPGFAAEFAASPASTIARESASVVFPELTSFVVLGRFVETKIATDVTEAVNSRKNTDLATAYGTAGIALVIVLLIAALSVAVARSVAEPLTQLTVNADRVARLAESELERVADDESDVTEPVRLQTVHVEAEDEVGDLARAFERVQSTAARLVERQVQSRRNVAEMLGHIGRRTQNLVGRQIAVIDGLEAEETDPDRLTELYRLDHMASRLRRNAGSLVVLSGASDASGHFAPLPLADVVRLALGEIEAYTRVDVAVPDSIVLSPAVINDVVLMLAELMENATTFSPPHTRVTVEAAVGGRQLIIVDHGIGLSDERLAEENRRLAQRERLDLAPSEVLGLFVVGRLARRHGIEVVLAATPGGGVAVRVDLSEHVLDSPTEVVPVSEPRRVRATAAVAEFTAQAGRHEASLREPTVERPVVPRPYHASTLDRAIRMLESAKPWNAFEVPQPALPAAPAPPSADAPVTADGYAAEPALATPTALAPTTPIEPPPATPADEELAVAARAALDELAAADARAAAITADAGPFPAVDDEASREAEQDAGQVAREEAGTSGPHSYWDSPPVPREPIVAPEFGTFQVDLPGAGAPMPESSVSAASASSPTAPVVPEWAVPDPATADPAAPGVAGIAPQAGPPYDAADTNLANHVGPPADREAPFAHRFAGNGMPLARRVPGATTRNAHTIPAPRQSRPDLDPIEAQQLIEQFEFGVARALREVEAEPRETEEA